MPVNTISRVLYNLTLDLFLPIILMYANEFEFTYVQILCNSVG